MILSKVGAAKTATVLIALIVMVSVVTVGVVAQPDSPNTNSSGEDTEPEPNDTIKNATPIEYDSEINATLSSPNDTDYYAVPATAGCAIIPRAQLTNFSKGGNIQVDLISPTGEVTTELTNDLMGGAQNVAGKDTQWPSKMAYTGNVMEYDGTYYIRVQKERNATDQSFKIPYNLTVNREFVDKYEPNENGSTATPVTVGDTLTARFAGYDSDVYALNVTAGEEYTITIDNSEPYNATKILYVYANRSQAADDPPWKHAEDGKSPYYFESNGPTVATTGTMRDESVSVAITPETNGTHYLQLVQDPENGNLLSLEEYKLTVSDDMNGDATNATHLSSGELLQGVTLSPGEEDWYAITGQAGQLLDVYNSMRVDIVNANGDVLNEEQGPTADPTHATKILESNGTYYIRVADTGEQGNETNASASHTYTLGASVHDIDQYDPNENASTATPLTVNETLTAWIAGPDSDVYAVDVEAGQNYTVTLNGTTFHEPVRRLFVYDTATGVTDDPSESNATPVANTSGDAPVLTARFTAETDDTHYVQVVYGVDERRSHMEYNLTVSSPGADSDTGGGDSAAEPNDDLENATPIAYGENISATLSSPNDTDYYAVNATAGDAIIPRLTQEQRLSGRTMRVDVVTPTGEVTTELSNDLMGGPENELLYEDTGYTGTVMESNGTYYVRVSVSSQNDASTDANPYTLTVNRSRLDDYEPNENGATATPIELGDAVNATFAGYDSDVYALNVTAGESYTITIDSSGIYNATKILYVYANRSQAADDPAGRYDGDGRPPYYQESNGSTVATTGTIRYDPVSVVITPETNGTHYLQLVQAPENGDLLGLDEYELTVNDDVNGDAANATHLSPDETLHGATVSPGEEDWYAITGQAGRLLAVNTWSHTESSLPDSVQINVVNANGDVLDEERDPTADPHHATKILESNHTYYIRVADTGEQSNGTNTSAAHAYGLGTPVEKLDQYDPNENASTATPLAVNETLTAWIAGPDSDVYAVNVEAGENYTVTLNGTTFTDPIRRLLVYDTATGVTDDPSESNTTPVANTSGDAPVLTTRFTAETDDTHYVQVVRGVGERMPHMEYNLTVTSPGVDSDTGDGDSDGGAEPNDDLENATPIPYGENISATLSSGDDVDYYSVNVTVGESLIPRLHLKNMFKGSAIRVDVVAPTGEVTTELTNDLNDGPENVAGTAVISPTDTAYTGDVMESDGTYYVRVMEENRTSSGAVQTSTAYRYNLTVNSTTLDQYEPNENGTTATSLDLGETVNAAFAGYDSDAYAVNLTAGQTYTLTTRSPGSKYSYDTYGKIRIYENQSQPVDDPDNGSPRHYNPNGSTVATSTVLYGETESIVFSPSTNGTYYIHLVQSPENGRLLESSAYELTVTETEPNDKMANATLVEYEQNVGATLSAGEEDWYTVDGYAGHKLLADVWNHDHAFDRALQIDVLTANGDVVAESSASDGDTVEYVMESNETYYIRVSESPAAETNGSVVYGYTLYVDEHDTDNYDVVLGADKKYEPDVLVHHL